MSASGLPFDDIRALCAMLPPPDGEAMAAVRARNAALAKPPGSLGRLEEIVEWMAGWQGTASPAVTRPLTAVFAGSHGVLAENISSCPAEETAARMAMAAAGGAAINQICGSLDIGLKVFELALGVPTGNIAQGPALDERDCTATIAFGMEAIAGGADLICLGETGAGNTTVASAVLAGLFGGPVADWVVPARDNSALTARRISVIERALAVHAGHLSDPLEVLRRLGGRETAALVGAILAARIQRIPVVMDGLGVAAAAAVLFAMNPSAIDHCLAGHVSGDAVHSRALARIGRPPLLSLGLTIGEGAGAALAVGVIRAALACHAQMATADQPPGTLN